MIKERGVAKKTKEMLNRAATKSRISNIYLVILKPSRLNGFFFPDLKILSLTSSVVPIGQMYPQKNRPKSRVSKMINTAGIMVRVINLALTAVIKTRAGSK